MLPTNICKPEWNLYQPQRISYNSLKVTDPMKLGTKQQDIVMKPNVWPGIFCIIIDNQLCLQKYMVSAE